MSLELFHDRIQSLASEDWELVKDDETVKVYVKNDRVRHEIYDEPGSKYVTNILKEEAVLFLSKSNFRDESFPAGNLLLMTKSGAKLGLALSHLKDGKFKILRFRHAPHPVHNALAYKAFEDYLRQHPTYRLKFVTGALQKVENIWEEG